jgi:hypothetical protein
MADDDSACAAASGEERCGQHEPLGEATNYLTRMVATRNGSGKKDQLRLDVCHAVLITIL